jgi:hypothetical protein
MNINFLFFRKRSITNEELLYSIAGIDLAITIRYRISRFKRRAKCGNYFRRVGK